MKLYIINMKMMYNYVKMMYNYVKMIYKYVKIELTSRYLLEKKLQNVFFDL